MIETKGVPLTTYGLLAQQHGVKSEDYVGRIVRGERRAIRGKAAEILEHWKQIEENRYNWLLDYKADQSVVVQMEDIKLNVFVQHGVSSVYKNNECVREESLDVLTTSINEFTKYLQGLRNEFR